MKIVAPVQAQQHRAIRISRADVHIKRRKARGEEGERKEKEGRRGKRTRDEHILFLLAPVIREREEEEKKGRKNRNWLCDACPAVSRVLGRVKKKKGRKQGEEKRGRERKEKGKGQNTAPCSCRALRDTRLCKGGGEKKKEGKGREGREERKSLRSQLGRSERKGEGRRRKETTDCGHPLYSFPERRTGLGIPGKGGEGRKRGEKERREEEEEKGRGAYV